MEELENIINFMEISPLILSSGQPTRAQFPAIQAAGCKAVINLALKTSTNAIPEEKELVESLGMTYIHIPVIWEKPTQADLETFFNVMHQWRDSKVYVHCVLNLRVSSFLYLYRVLHLGMPEEEVRWDLLTIWDPDEVWARFIADSLQSCPDIEIRGQAEVRGKP